MLRTNSNKKNLVFPPWRFYIFLLFLVFFLFSLQQSPPFLARLLRLEGRRQSSSVPRRCRPTRACLSGTRRRPPCVPCGTGRTEQQRETKKEKSRVVLLQGCCYFSTYDSMMAKKHRTLCTNLERSKTNRSNDFLALFLFQANHTFYVAERRITPAYQNRGLKNM